MDPVDAVHEFRIRKGAIIVVEPRDGVYVGERRHDVRVAVAVDVGREDGVGVLVIIAPDDLYFENLERG